METRTINDSLYFTFITEGSSLQEDAKGRGLQGWGLCTGWCPPGPSVVLQGWCSAGQLPGDPPKAQRRAAWAMSHHPFAQHQQSSSLTSSAHAYKLLMRTPSLSAAKSSPFPQGGLRTVYESSWSFVPNSNKYSPHDFLPFAFLPSKACSFSVPLPHKVRMKEGCSLTGIPEPQHQGERALSNQQDSTFLHCHS